MGARKRDAVDSASSRFLGLGVLLGIVLVVVSVAMLRHARYEGLIRPFRIQSASMAPSLPGERFQNPCQDCGFSIEYAVDSSSDGEWLTCPNCGYRKTPTKLSSRQPGQRVLIDRWAKYLTGIKRWEVVAFRRTIDGDRLSRRQQLAVKRVVGLPGEQISLSSGEIYADGVLQRKSLHQFQKMAVLLFDSDYRPQKTQGLIDRFQPINEPSRWKRLATGYRFDSDPSVEADSESAIADDLDQLVYQHWSCMADQVPRKERTKPSRVEDHYPYNFGRSRGHLLPVNDLLCQVSLVMQDKGSLVISLFSLKEVFEVRLHLREEKYELYRQSSCIAKGRFLHSLKKELQELEFAVVDRQIILAVNGRIWRRLVISQENVQQREMASPLDSEHPLMMAARDTELQIQRLRLYRDIYWTGPLHTADRWQFKRQLRPAEFFLLGDNVPVSEDSRHWEQGIMRKAILGKVLRDDR